MNLLSCNCRGLGQPRTFQELVCLVQTYHPKIVFLSERRQCEEKVKAIRWRIGLKHCRTNDGKGKGAGIALFWDEAIKKRCYRMGLAILMCLWLKIPMAWRGGALLFMVNPNLTKDTNLTKAWNPRVFSVANCYVKEEANVTLIDWNELIAESDILDTLTEHLNFSKSK